MNIKACGLGFSIGNSVAGSGCCSDLEPTLLCFWVTFVKFAT